MERINISLGALFIVIVCGTLYSRKKDKRLMETYDYDDDQSKFMRKVLIDETQLAKTSKPILWVHLPFEKNSRKLALNKYSLGIFVQKNLKNYTL